MAEDCPAIDLRTPGGERIDLNGTWATELEGTRSGIYFFRQVGTCVWFSGGYPGVPSQRRRGVEGDLGPLDLVTVVFFGHIRSDFTITGEWVDVREQFHPTSSLPRGTIRLNIEVDGPNAVRLVYAGGEGQPFIEPGIRENQSWVKVADQGAYPVPD